MNIVSQTGRFFISVIVVSILLVILSTILLYSLVKAEPAYPKLPERSLYINSAEPGATTNYTISWRYPSNTTIGSIKLVLCSDPYVLDPCSSTPPGDFSGGNLINQSGITGFSILSQSTNEIVLSRPSAAAGTVLSSYEFENMVNPTGLQQKFYIQIFTYSTSDATGSPNHISSVINTTTTPISINTEVPPILYFCAALTVDEWCQNINGNFIDYGILDPVNGHSATSQFGVATNALGGYVVTVNGNTMTSGNKKIEALEVPANFISGVPQFGLNLRANTTPALGQDVTGDGIGMVTSDYNNPDLFKFSSGDTIATAVTGSLFNTYTATYILNIPPDQPSGVYNTTLAYICTAAF